MDKLNLLKIFITVVDQGSFSAAAVLLGLSPSTVSKAIGRLEQDIQLHLFHRTTRSLTLTDNGMHYAITVRKLVTELESCETALSSSNDTPEGHLKINLPISYGRLYVLPLLSEFSKQYPKITLELSFDDAYVDMIEKGVDICIRSGTLDDSSLVARQLSPIDFLICASSEYLKNHPPVDRYNLSMHSWIRFRFRQTGRLMPIMMPDGKFQTNVDPGRQFIVDDGEALAELCAKGVGLTQMPHFIARNWIQSNKVRAVFPYYRPSGFGVWIIYAKREFQPAKINAFVSFMEASVRKTGESAYHTWAEDLDFISQ